MVGVDVLRTLAQGPGNLGLSAAATPTFIPEDSMMAAGPDSGDAPSAWQRVLLSRAHAAEAEKALQEAYTIGGPTQARTAHLYLASIYSTRKEYQKAITELETYLRENPKAPNASQVREAIAKMKTKL